MYWQYLTEKPGETADSSDLNAMSDAEFNRRRDECIKQYGDG